MNTIKLRPIITVEEKNTFVSEIQEAFQISYVSEFGEFEKQVLPAEDIEESFNAKGAEAYIAEIDGERKMCIRDSVETPEFAGWWEKATACEWPM